MGTWIIYWLIFLGILSTVHKCLIVLAVLESRNGINGRTLHMAGGMLPKGVQEVSIGTGVLLGVTAVGFLVGNIKMVIEVFPQSSDITLLLILMPIGLLLIVFFYYVHILRGYASQMNGNVSSELSIPQDKDTTKAEEDIRVYENSTQKITFIAELQLCFFLVLLLSKSIMNPASMENETDIVMLCLIGIINMIIQRRRKRKGKLDVIVIRNEQVEYRNIAGKWLHFRKEDLGWVMSYGGYSIKIVDRRNKKTITNYFVTSDGVNELCRVIDRYEEKEKKIASVPTKKKNKKIRLLILILLCGAFLVIGGSSCAIYKVEKQEVRYRPVEGATEWGIAEAVRNSPEMVKSEKELQRRREDKLTYHESIQEAINTYYEVEFSKTDMMDKSDEILRIGDEKKFCIWFDGTDIFGETFVTCFMVNYKAQQYSTPLHKWEQYVKGGMTLGTYQEEDRVIRDIVSAYVNMEVLKLANDGVPLFYGFGMEERMKELTILGEKPDEVKEIDYQGEKYYFWYYKDGTRILEKCEESTGWQKKTMKEAIEYFQVKIGGVK